MDNEAEEENLELGKFVADLIWKKVGREMTIGEKKELVEPYLDDLLSKDRNGKPKESKRPISSEFEVYKSESTDEIYRDKKSKAEEKFEEKKIKFIKENWFEAYGKEPTEEEIENQKIELVKIEYLLDSWTDEYFENIDLEHRLLSEKKGFPINADGKSCSVCGYISKDDNFWFDSNGLKCQICQKAIKDKVIPPSVSRNRKTWMSELEMRQNFQLDGNKLNKLLKSGEIISRNIMTLNGKSLWFRVFIEKENRNFIYRYFYKILDNHMRTLDKQTQKK